MQYEDASPQSTIWLQPRGGSGYISADDHMLGRRRILAHKHFQVSTRKGMLSMKLSKAKCLKGRRCLFDPQFLPALPEQANMNCFYLVQPEVVDLS